MFGSAMIDMLIPAEERQAMAQQAGALLDRLQRAEASIYRTEHKVDVILRAVLKMAEKSGIDLTDDVSLITDASIVSEVQNVKPI